MKTNILLLFLIICEQTFACRCDFSEITRLKKDPALARTAIIGSFESTKEKGKFNFKTKRAWSKSDSITAIDMNGSCSQAFKPDTTYLLLSFNDVDFLNKRGIGVTICDSILVELSKGKELVEKLESIKPKTEHVANPTWQYCQADKDCILINSPCDNTEAINIKYKKSYELWKAVVTPKMNCSPTNKKSSEAAKCISNLCEILK